MCRERGRIQRLKKKRPALQEIDPNISLPFVQQRATLTSQVPFLLSIINQGPILPVNPLVSLVRPP